MPFKNPADKLAWRREYAKRFNEKHTAWRKAAYERDAPNREAAALKRECKKNETQNRRDIKAVSGAINEMRLRIMERDGLCKCYACQKTKPYSEMTKIIGNRKSTGTCKTCGNKAAKQWIRKQGNGYTTRKTLERFKRDTLFLFTRRTRDRIQKGIRSFARGAKVSHGKLRYLGCTTQEAFKYIQQQFVKGMTWDNYGEWHIDHVVPLCSFDLSIEQERCRVFHYSNMRPLWAADNIKKGGKPLCKPYQPTLLLV